ncbi:lipopolysaccharide transport periplasmic protein LptA [Zavarzinia sp.]|uniref:lipopolysaccharide transport periplasmic protein LptA n=1 Tax=Zavarzinia sp. TaxID=2027920 RepID=UPI003565D891
MTTMVRVLRRAAALSLAGSLAFAATALGQGATPAGPPRLNFNSSAPIEILADSLEVQDQSSSAVFSGNVKVTQADMILRADRLEVTYAGGSVTDTTGGPSAIKKIIAKGNVFVTSKEDTAQGDAAVYEPEKGVVTMTGNVILTRGQNVLKGSELVVNLHTGRSVMTGGSADGRVKGLIVPNSAGGAAAQ